MNRTAINPTSWSVGFGFNQGELLENPSRILFLSGQVSIDDDGRPQHDGDLGAQAGLAMDNIAATLEKAGMTLSNVVKMTIYTTDVSGLMRDMSPITDRMKSAGVLGAQTLIGVAALALPQLLIEIDATAVG